MMGDLAECAEPQRSHAADADALPSLLSLLVDELAYGVLVVSPQGRILHANQAGAAELVRERVLSVDRAGVLVLLQPDNQRLLLDALARAADGKRGLVEFAAPHGPALTAAVVPLRTAGRRNTQVALLFARASVGDPLMLSFFARSHRLTAAEEGVLAILCMGYSAPQAAKQLNVAVSTVRSHVRNMCAKTRSSGVRELVSRVALLPPMAAPFWRGTVH
jgi:DNA-binding CsgD family transcriptional regulator